MRSINMSKAWHMLPGDQGNQCSNASAKDVVRSIGGIAYAATRPEGERQDFWTPRERVVRQSGVIWLPQLSVLVAAVIGS